MSGQLDASRSEAAAREAECARLRAQLQQLQRAAAAAATASSPLRATGPATLQSPQLGRITADSHLPPAPAPTVTAGPLRDVAGALDQAAAEARVDAIVERLQMEKAALLDYISDTRAALAAAEAAAAAAQAQAADLTSRLTTAEAARAEAARTASATR